MPALLRSTATLFLLILLTPALSGQNATVGTEFWLGYMENLTLAFNDQPVFTIVISAEQPTSGTVEAPVTGLSIPFSVPAGVTEVELPAAIFYSEGSDNVDNKGLLITTDAPTRIDARHYRSFFSESTTLLPTSELGTEYLVTTPVDAEPSNHPASFVIVATQDATEVQITPTALTLGLFPADLPYTVTLDRGENYQVQSLGDLSGSRIESLNGTPVAVFSGAMQANIGDCNGGADSHVWDQALPLDFWSDQYYFVPFLLQSGDEIKILAAEDDTEVFFDCEPQTILNAGESLTLYRNVATVITATGPISLTQYNREASCQPNDLGDPNGLNCLPSALRGNAFSWFASDRPRTVGGLVGYFSQHAVTVISPTADGVLLDGAPLVGFTPFPGNSALFFLRTTVSGGTHELTAETPVQAYTYGYGEFDAYTNNLGYTLVESIDYSCLEFEIDGALCVDSTLTLVYSSPLDVTSQIWDFGNGTSSTFSVGQIAYATPGVYTITLTVTTGSGSIFTESQTVEVVNCSLPNPCDTIVNDLVLTADLACAGSVSTFQLFTDLTLGGYYWVIAGDTIFDEVLKLDHTFDTAGEYDIRVVATTIEDCVFTADLAVTISDCPVDCPNIEPDVVLSIAGTFCVDSSVYLQAIVTDPEIVVDSIIWIDSTGQRRNSSEGLTLTLPQAGTIVYQYEIYTSDSCRYDFTRQFGVVDCSEAIDCAAEVPNVQPVLLSEACVDALLSIDLILIDGNGGLVDSVVWLTEPDLRYTGPLVEGLRYNTPRTIRFDVEVYKNNGCVYSDSLIFDLVNCSMDTTIIMPPDSDQVDRCMLFWPNAFSPNLDGINDQFRPFFGPDCAPADFQMIIFDRWGGQLYTTNDPLRGWSGNKNGRKMSGGVYTYVATYRLPDGSLQRTAGSFALLR